MTDDPRPDTSALVAELTRLANGHEAEAELWGEQVSRLVSDAAVTGYEPISARHAAHHGRLALTLRAAASSLASLERRVAAVEAVAAKLERHAAALTGKKDAAARFACGIGASGIRDALAEEE